MMSVGDLTGVEKVAPSSEDGIRLAKKVDRDNVGVMLNFCHWMKAQQGKNLKPLLEDAMPHLFIMTINGSDHEGNWDHLIQP